MSGECFGCGHHVMDCICKYAGLGEDDNPKTVVVGSKEDRDRKTKLVNLRISQAKDELSGIELTEDQYSMLCEALDRIGQGIRESI